MTPIVKAVLEEFVPDAAEAIEMVNGRACLVDGTITPCWSYGDHPELWSRKHGTTGFNAQLLSLLDGTAIYVSDPLPGKTHDAKAFTETPVADIVAHSGGAIGDKDSDAAARRSRADENAPPAPSAPPAPIFVSGYQGHVDATPRKKPRGGQLSKSDQECNAEISALRAPIERVVAHFKSWRMLHTDYRRPYHTYRDAYDAARGLFFFSIIWGFE